jgi:hypothetical protein
MERPTRVEGHRWLGDKRNQKVYDLDDVSDEGVIEELIGSEQARNRGYRLRRI